MSNQSAKSEKSGGAAAIPRSLVTQTGQYALRALAHVAERRAQGPVKAADLARATGVPLAYLQKVLRRLVEGGLLVSQKGHGGGFTLSRPPERIRFVQVLNAVEGLPQPNLCVFGWGECDASKPCPLHPAWSRLDGAVRGWAESTTLGDLSGRPKAKRERRATPSRPQRLR